MAYADGKSFILKAGSFFLAFPNQIHFYHDQETVEGYIVIFTPELFRDLKDIFRSQVPACPIMNLSDAPAELEKRLEMILCKSKSELPLEQTIAKGYLLILLAQLLSNTTLSEAPADYDHVKQLLLYCSEHYEEPLSLDMVSQALHLNKYYISHIFSSRLHVSFTDFINSLRVEHACPCLEKGVNITDVALSSGFSSIRTFNRAFLRQMGMTPREYIRQKEMT